MNFQSFYNDLFISNETTVQNLQLIVNFMP